MQINYKPQLPEKVHPIYIIGAGGIVRDAHLPAYKKAGFKVEGIFNKTKERAQKLADQYDIPVVSDNIESFIQSAPDNAIFDLAIMPTQFVRILNMMPDGSAVLLQKPMGDNYQQSLAILDVCRKKNLKAAVNCQLRFAPFVSAARDLISRGLLGELYDMEIKLTTFTPWEYFPNVVNHPRLEIQQHSIHHIDLIRSFLGDPKGVMAKTLRNPARSMSSTRSTILLDYGDALHVTVNTNHDHEYDITNQESYIKWEGTKGVVKAKMGLLMNYPDGEPDQFEYCLKEDGKASEWQTVDLEGSWFPDAFIGMMASLQRFVEGSTKELPTHVEDVIKTMAVVEAAYASNDMGGVKPDFSSFEK